MPAPLMPPPTTSTSHSDGSAEGAVVPEGEEDERGWGADILRTTVATRIGSRIFVVFRLCSFVGDSCSFVMVEYPHGGALCFV